MTHRVVALSIVTGLLAIADIPAQRGQRGNAQDREARRQARQQQLQKALQAPRPIEALDSVWIEELTWMEVRDAIKAGKKTAIIATGGIEQNGPYVATGKHNYVLQGACEGIARELGDALVAPIIKLVPEGGIERPSGHMLYPGTISLRQETFEAVLTDVGSSLRAHGVEHIIYIGDSGGNTRGMVAAAKAINEKAGETVAHHIPEFYDYRSVGQYLENELGIKETANDGIHDSYPITALMMTVDPAVVRYDQRVKAGKATINGVSIAPKEASIEVGKKLMQFRVDQTCKAIRKAIGGEGKAPR